MGQAARTLGVQLALALSSIAVGLLIRAPLERAVGMLPGGLIAGLVAVGTHVGLIVWANREVRGFALSPIRKVAQ